MSHHHLGWILASALSHLLQPHGAHHTAAHPFAEGVKALGGDMELAPGVDAYALGKTRLGKGDAQGALAAFRQALEARPGSVEALNGVAVSWDTLGRPDLARRFYEEALFKTPDSPFLANNLGFSYFIAGDAVQARALLRRAVSGNDLRVTEVARRTLAKLDEPSAPVAEVARQPELPGAPNIERIDASHQLLTTRRSGLQPAVGRQPSRTAYDRGPSEAKFSVPRAALAAAALENGYDTGSPPPRLIVLADQSDSHAVSFSAPSRSANRGRHSDRPTSLSERASPCADPATGPDQLPGRQTDAALEPKEFATSPDAASKTQAFQAADAATDKATGPPPQPLAALEWAEAQLRSGQLDEAAVTFESLTGNPSVAASAWSNLGSTRLRQGRPALAVVALNRSLALDSTSVGTLVLRGVAADTLRDWRNADLAYGRAFALNPKSFLVLANRGYSRLLQGHYPEALSDLERAAVIDPRSRPVQTNLRVAKVMAGDYKNAEARTVAAASLPEDLNTMGFAAMVKGDYDRAETYFTRAMELNPRFDYVAWDNLTYLKQLVLARPQLRDLK